MNQQFNPDKVRMLQLSGLKYTWSNNLPFGEKVLDIYLPNGEKIDPAAKYTATVNNFMAGGGDNYTALLNGTDKVIGPTDLEGLVNYVKAQSAPLNPTIEGRAIIDEVGPDAPVVNKVTDQSTSVTGTTESGSLVEVKKNNEVLGTATANESGSFTVQIPAQTGGTELVVTAKDQSRKCKC